MTKNIHDKKNVKLYYYINAWIIIVHDYVNLDSFQIINVNIKSNISYSEC